MQRSNDTSREREEFSILLVEDNNTNIRLVEKTLKDFFDIPTRNSLEAGLANYNLQSKETSPVITYAKANNGAHVLRLVKEKLKEGKNFSLIIMDNTILPNPDNNSDNKTGSQLTAEIRDIEKGMGLIDKESGAAYIVTLRKS